MNDGNIRYYLEQHMNNLKTNIKMTNDAMEGYLRQIDDWVKKKKNLQIHYTSLLNTAIAYGYEVEEDGKDRE